MAFLLASRVAVEHLIGNGHRRIGLVSGAPSGLTISARELEWEDGLVAAGLLLGTLEIIWIYNDFFWRVLFTRSGSKLPSTTGHTRLQRQFVAGLTLGASKG